MKNLFFAFLFGICIIITGVGCSSVPKTTNQQNLNQPQSMVTCQYKDKTLFAGESYYDGCNYHACQKNGAVISTEKACENP